VSTNQSFADKLHVTD